MNVEALRTWKTKRNGDRVATIELLLDGEVVAKVGGNRCARAEAVIALKGVDSDVPWVYGVRGDLMKAMSEATKMETATTQKIDGVAFAVTPWPYARAIKVIDKPE